MNLKTVAGVALLSAVALASAQSPMEVAKKSCAAYKKAMMTSDVSHFDKGSTADFTYVGVHGEKMDKKQAMAGLKAQLPIMKVKSMDIKIVSAKKAEGGIVYVSDTKMVAEVKMGGPKPAKMVSTMRDETLVVNKGGKWLYKRVKMMKDDTTVDGKPLKM